MCAVFYAFPAQYSRFEQIFVQSNHGGDEESRIDVLDVFGILVEYVILIHFLYHVVEHVLRTTKDLSGLKKLEE